MQALQGRLPHQVALRGQRGVRRRLPGGLGVVHVLQREETTGTDQDQDREAEARDQADALPAPVLRRLLVRGLLLRVLTTWRRPPLPRLLRVHPARVTNNLTGLGGFGGGRSGAADTPVAGAAGAAGDVSRKPTRAEARLPQSRT
ncbi:hypothetical protein GCM10023108_50310 [Saccharopolyspora hordei]